MIINIKEPGRTIISLGWILDRGIHPIGSLLIIY